MVLLSLLAYLSSLPSARSLEKACLDPAASQLPTLLRIIRENRDTEFGREHSFHSIRTIWDYQFNVPISKYKDLSPCIERMKDGEDNILTKDRPLMFGITSGTTGKPKFIPITPSFISEYRRSWLSWICLALDSHPGILSRIATFVSPSNLGTTGSGIPYGSVSGLLQEIQPWLVRSRYVLDPAIFSISDYESRYYVISRFMLAKDISVIVTPNPGMILLVYRNALKHMRKAASDIREGRISADIEPAIMRRLLAQVRPDPKRASFLESLDEPLAKDIWDLKLIACWKEGNMPLYLRQMKRYFKDVPIRDIGMMATEGSMTVPFSDEGGEGMLALGSHFYEFIPADKKDMQHPPVFDADSLEQGRDYYIILTASNGLYRYDMNDIVRVTGFRKRCPVLQFLHKGEHFASIAGEKLSEWQVMAAVREASHEFCLPVEAFTACVHWAQPPCYAFYVEFHDHTTTGQMRALLEGIDARLRKLNIEYCIKRDSMRLGSPILRRVREGSYHDRHRHLVSKGAHDAQVKHPCLMDDVSFDSHFKEHLKVVEEVKLDRR